MSEDKKKQVTDDAPKPKPQRDVFLEEEIRKGVRPIQNVAPSDNDDSNSEG